MKSRHFNFSWTNNILQIKLYQIDLTNSQGLTDTSDNNIRWKEKSHNLYICYLQTYPDEPNGTGDVSERLQADVAAGSDAAREPSYDRDSDSSLEASFLIKN